MKDWAAVEAAALRLPETERSTSYGRAAVKLRGRPIVNDTAPADDSFVLHVTEADKAVLLDTDPATFWQTAHYAVWPAILVRYGRDADGRVERLFRRAWWGRATAALRREFGDRP